MYLHAVGKHGELDGHVLRVAAVVPVNQRVKHYLTHGIHGVLRDIHPLPGILFYPECGAHVAVDKTHGSIQQLWQIPLQPLAVGKPLSLTVHLPQLRTGNSGGDDGKLREVGLGIGAEQKNGCQRDLPITSDAGQFIELFQRHRCKIGAVQLPFQQILLHLGLIQ